MSLAESGTETGYLFSGKELDGETGLTYFGRRYYRSEAEIPIFNLFLLKHIGMMRGLGGGGCRILQGNIRILMFIVGIIR
jgi:hypothetical protein